MTVGESLLYAASKYPCPICGSGVRLDGNWLSTCGYSPPFERNGEYHEHDPNWSETTGRCCNKEFKIRVRSECPALVCDYRYKVEINEEPSR